MPATGSTTAAWARRTFTAGDIGWTRVGQAAKGARDDDLTTVVDRCEGETAIQLKWLRTRMKTAAPQVLVVT